MSSISNSYISKPKVMGIYLEQDNLVKAVQEQVDGYVKNPSQSDRTYAIMGRSYVPTIRIIFNNKVPLSLRPIAKDSDYSIKCLLLTNIYDVSNEWQLLHTIQAIIRKSGIDHLKSLHQTKIGINFQSGSDITWVQSMKNSELFSKDLCLYVHPSAEDHKETGEMAKSSASSAKLLPEAQDKIEADDQDYAFVKALLIKFNEYQQQNIQAGKSNEDCIIC